jgi:hypothetical protein
LAGTYEAPNSALGVYVYGDYAFVAIDTSGLQVINISNPTNPIYWGSYDTPGLASDVVVFDNYAFVADYSNGVQVINIADPAAPQLTGSFNTSSFVWGIFYSDNYAYLANTFSGLTVINVVNPINPSYLGSYNTPGYAEDIFVQGNYIYIADYTSMIILRFDPAIIDENNKLPSTFSLSPNYPNPFNSSTTIRYNLPTESPVSIDIYDILGRKVQTLLDVKEQTGAYQVNWNADGLPSGAYFARLKAGEKSQTTKMVLMK